MKRAKKVIVFTTPMDGEDIAKRLGVCRQAVSQTLKRSLEKVYHEIRKMNPEFAPFQIASQMMEMFNIKSPEDAKKFYSLFPPILRSKIMEDAKKYLRIRTVDELEYAEEE
jgi:predicted DNA-binding protein YlxM (UPF0122 family)